MNNCAFIGRCGKDGVTRFTESGKSVTGWSLAVDTGWGDNKQTTWIDCSAWGDRFEKVAEYILKGNQIGVVGAIGTREHDGKTYVTLNVREITLINNKPKDGATSDEKPRSKPPREPAMAGADDFEDSNIPF